MAHALGMERRIAKRQQASLVLAFQGLATCSSISAGAADRARFTRFIIFGRGQAHLIDAPRRSALSWLGRRYTTTPTVCMLPCHDAVPAKTPAKLLHHKA